MTQRSKRRSPKITEQGAADLASRIAYTCVRNCGVLEELHIRYDIDQADMKRLMIAVTNYIYTALLYPSVLQVPLPHYWAEPEIPDTWKEVLTMEETESTNTSTSTTRETDT